MDIIRGNPGAAPPQVQIIGIDEDTVGQRVDNFLLRRLKGVPKTHIYRMIRSGEVRVNKARVQAQTRLVLGDLLRLPPVRVAAPDAEKINAARAFAQAPRCDFTVLFEDEAMLLIDKPAGLAVHGGSGVSFGVIEQLRITRPQAKFLELVHRLDRATSGVLLVAKKSNVLKKLQDQFRQRQTGKIYLALVRGRWPSRLKVLDQPLQKYLLPAPVGQLGERRVRVLAKDDPAGKASLSLVKVRASSDAYSLLEVTLKTGRTHQIRVHLASAGFPLVGDDKYGDFELNKVLARSDSTFGLKRMFLHAWCLRFNHPLSLEPMQLCAELPAELKQFCLAVLPHCGEL